MKFSKKAFEGKINEAKTAGNNELAERLQKDLDFYQSNSLIAESRPRREYTSEQQKHIDAIDSFFKDAKENSLKKHVEALIGTTFLDAKSQTKTIKGVRVYFDTGVKKPSTFKELSELPIEDEKVEDEKK